MKLIRLRRERPARRTSSNTSIMSFPDQAGFCKSHFLPRARIAPAQSRFPSRAAAASQGEALLATITITAELVRPRHLRPRREKIFGPPPERHLDGNSKARIWAAAAAYNAQHRRAGQHQGPSDLGDAARAPRAACSASTGPMVAGKCFPAYEKLAAAARCARSSVAVALHALEKTGLLTWVHRLARQRRQERDLFGKLVSVWQVIRISNGYSFTDPIDREPGRKSL